jgi:hypothetical protein
MPSEKTVTKSPIAAIKTSAKSSADKVAKTAPKRKHIKYEDKSGGQPELISIFNSIKALMKLYVKGTLKERGEAAGIYNLVSEKQVEIEGRKKDELYFASIIIQKGYVGFYFMPVYGVNKPEEVFHPNLLKHLKGKACFHIKKNDPDLLEQIKDALKVGLDLYKKRGWF